MRPLTIPGLFLNFSPNGFYVSGWKLLMNMNAVRTEQILSNLMKLAEIISASYAKRKYESPALQCYIQGRIDGINEMRQYIQNVATTNAG